MNGRGRMAPGGASRARRAPGAVGLRTTGVVPVTGWQGPRRGRPRRGPKLGRRIAGNMAGLGGTPSVGRVAAPKPAVPRPAGPRLRRAGGRRTPEFMILLGLIVTLNLAGLVMVLSASSVSALESYGTSWYFFQRQAVWSVVGMVVLLGAQRIDYHRWRRWAGIGLLGSILLLVAVLVPGVGVGANGATRWLGYGPVGVQPSELAKLGLLVWCASLLGRRINHVRSSEATLRPVLVVTAVVALLVMLQPNLGTTIVLGAIVLTLLFVAGVPLSRLGAIGALGASAATLMAFAAPYRRARVFAFLDPWADPLNSGYQTIQAWAAIAEGGLSGVGVGASRAKWGFLPFAHTDFIFAIVAEEFGLIGAVGMILLFVLLGLIGIRAAMRAPDALGMLLAAGVTSWFVVQAFVNIGAVIGVLPITGVPLPFVSSGGSSLVASMAAAGVLLNVARHGDRPRAAPTDGERRAAPGPTTRAATGVRPGPSATGRSAAGPGAGGPAAEGASTD